MARTWQFVERSVSVSRLKQGPAIYEPVVLAANGSCEYFLPLQKMKHIDVERGELVVLHSLDLLNIITRLFVVGVRSGHRTRCRSRVGKTDSLGETVPGCGCISVRDFRIIE